MENPIFEWIEGDKTYIKITKRTGVQMVLRKGDFIHISTYTKTIYTKDNKLETKTIDNIICKVVGIDHPHYSDSSIPAYILCHKWSESTNTWMDAYGEGIALYTHHNQDSIDSITTTTNPDLSKKGGRRMRLKSRKNSSKKNRRITRRR